ncbi:MAG: DUF6282 family protein [Dehalococcoidia bacterium]
MTQHLTERIDAIWRGSIDIHAHAAPDPIAARRHDALELARACRDAGMRAIIFKSHEYPTAPAAYVINRVVEGFTVFGAISLDEEVGGLNPFALEASAKMGAAKVWMPTFCAAHWRRTRMSRGDGITVLDEAGRLLPVVNDLLDIIKQYNLIMGSGHLAPEEQQVLVPEARRRGIKTVITHAEMTPVPVELTTRFSRLGAYVEHAYIALTARHGTHTTASIAASIREDGPAQAILSTDLGQTQNASPPEGLRMFIAAMLQEGLSDDEVRRMVQDNPAALLGLA